MHQTGKISGGTITAIIEFENALNDAPVKLVYGYVTGYGEKGPDKDLPGFDFTSFLARGGMLGTLFDKDHVPMMTVPGAGDHQVAMNLASGLLAALYRASRTDAGDRVTVSLFHSAIWDVGIMLHAAQKDLAEWCERFKAADIPCAVAQTWDEPLHRPQQCTHPVPPILCRSDFGEWDLSSLRTGFIGGSLYPAGLFRQINDGFGFTQGIWGGWMGTETSTSPGG